MATHLQTLVAPLPTIQSPLPVLVQIKLEYIVHHVYILKLSDGTFYIGRSENLVIRLQEHKDGTQQQTRGMDPKLVYFERFEGERDEVRERENDLTLMNQTGTGRRQLREMIEDLPVAKILADSLPTLYTMGPPTSMSPPFRSQKSFASVSM